MRALARWRPALRMAWRDLRDHRLRTLVVTLLVALPIAVAVVASTMASTSDYYSSNSLYAEYGSADAKVSVTAWPRVRVDATDGGRYTYWRKTRGTQRDDRRDPAAVDVGRLLPAGSEVTRVGETQVPLASGGTVYARILDLESPLTTGLGELASGRAPQAADEVAVSEGLADELGLLDGDGRLAAGATLDLVDGALSVVGLVTPDTPDDLTTVVVPPATSLVTGPVDAGTTADYLVDLPAMPTADLRALRSSLAEAGASAWMRDAVEHPGAWGLPTPLPKPVDPSAVAVGALVIGLGLVEVLVLVGATFAVGARRQSRTLGLLVASGGTPSDVRRTVLAHGVWIGLVAAVVGVGGGLAALAAGRDPLGRLNDTRIHDYSLSVGTILAVAALGAVSAVAAAAIPAWGVGRMTAAQALDEHVAVGGRRSTRRLGSPALALVGVGVVGLALCGPWIARTYAGSPAYPSPVPVVVGALFALVLLVGALLGTPTLVEAAGRVLSRGWLPWRLATRDAARHRGRTWAAVLAIGMVTTGAVFAGFGVSAANASARAENDQYDGLPPDAISIYLDPATVDAATLERVGATVDRVVGTDGVAAAYQAVRDRRTVTAPRGTVVLVVDDAWLRVIGVPAAARQTFADGTALATRPADARDVGDGAALAAPRVVRDGALALHSGRGTQRQTLSTPALEVGVPGQSGDVYLPRSTAERLGLGLRPTGQLLGAAPGADEQDAERLRLYGIDAQVSYDGGTTAPAVVYAGAGGAIALTGLVVGMIVALAAAEGRGDAATLAAVGAPPWTRRAMSAGQALFVGSLGAVVGLVLGSASGASLLQVVGTAGTPVPWGALALFTVGVPALCALVGWLVTPGRLALTRRTA